MRVVVPDRNARRQAEDERPGESHPIADYLVTVEISDNCPSCGGPRGKPLRRRYSADNGEGGYVVDSWDNECGHVDTYPDVITEAFERAGGTR